MGTMYVKKSWAAARKGIVSAPSLVPYWILTQCRTQERRGEPSEREETGNDKQGSEVEFLKFKDSRNTAVSDTDEAQQ